MKTINENGSAPKVDDRWKARWRWAKEANKKSTEANKPKESRVSIIQLYSFADRLDYLLMFMGAIGAVGHGLGAPLVMVFMGRLLNGIGTSANYGQFALDYLWIAILCFGSSWLEVALWMHTGQRQSAKLRVKYLQALLRQDVAFFDTDTNTGDIVHSIATDTLAVQDAISEKTGHFLQYLSAAVACITLALYYQWNVAVVTFAVMPAIALVGGMNNYFTTGFKLKASSAYSEAGSIAHQAISQVRTIHSFVAEEKVVKTYSDALQKPLEIGVKSGMVKGIGLGMTNLVLFCSYSLLVFYGGILVRQKHANGGSTVATIFLTVSGSLFLAIAMSNMTPFSNAQASAFNIFQVINHEPSINKPDETPRIITPRILVGHIELRNVYFSYPSRPEVPIFRKFSLIIPQGKTVSIVGGSGSGKSTVVALIERFYDPTKGKVLLDGLDVKKLDLKWFRSQIGLVNQEPALFATTIAANIAYGRENASQKEIEKAAKVANAHSFISQLPNGYQTEVGERGAQLSGGQKQRIAIARAIAKSPRILLLDEATSALDAGSEQVVQEALDRIMRGRTTVVVAYRLSTIRNADNIAVVEKGRIVESGTHHDLISKAKGAYSALILLHEPIHSNNPSEVNLAKSPYNSPERCFSPESQPFTSNHAFHNRIMPFLVSPRSPYEGLSYDSSILNFSARATVQPQQEEILHESYPLKPLKGPIKRLIAMTGKNWKYGVTAMIASIGIGAISPAYGLFFGYILGDYYNPNLHFMKKDIARFSFFYCGLGIFAFFMYSIQSYSVGVFGETVINRLREKLLSKILRNELGWFDEAENNTGRLTARLASDTVEIKATLGDTGAALVSTITTLLIGVPIGLIIQWKLALVMLFTSIPLITSAKVFEATAYQRATQVAGDAVSNIRTVAAFSAENKVQALFTNELKDVHSQSFPKGHIAGFLYGLSQFVLYTSQGLGLWYAGKLVASGESTFTAAIKVFFVFVISSYVSANAFTIAPDLAKGGEAIASLFQIIDRVTKIDPDNSEGEKVETIEGEIKLRHVTMVYPSRPEFKVLREMSFEVKSGNSLALVGASGSGKSSILALIERFYDPLYGEVLIDGMNIKRYNLKSLRQHIAMVQQEPALFATTINENILLGKAGASDAEAIEAAKAANAHNFISSLPEGYKTLVGERGVQLSGGQKQRVAIARAVLKDPIIFLLDEATSALDAESEKIVQNAIDRLMYGRTTVIVAHRLSTIRAAGSIAVVENGTIVEQGSHEALLNQAGAYSRLIQLQQHA